ncbi:MAG: TetR/AcrR family transcriptional regulator [Myxococcales bacterium]|nr:TetR/AcrR family transcriptional regulator [Myxococcales bacterium]MCB9651656.1 TetR/AcrR family transcriptional regulator [Deltaproteobacteria bacterium]
MTRHLPEQARREQILSAARRCFIESGYHPTRMDDIARAAGLSKGGVYFHFKSKQEVFESLVDEEFQASMRFLEEVTSGSALVAEKMQNIAAHYMEYFNAAPDAPRFFIVMGEMALRDEALASKLLEMQTAFIVQVSKLIDQGVAEGMLRATDSRTVAALLKALLDGVEGLKALGYTLDGAQLVAGGMDLVINGLLNRP